MIILMNYLKSKMKQLNFNIKNPRTFAKKLVGNINFNEKIFGRTLFLYHEVIADSDIPANMISEFG